MRDLAGRTAVVTGAANGIGLAIARYLHEVDAAVVAVDVDEVRLRETAAGWTTVVGDLSGDTTALAEEILAGYGPVELVVNNVGIASGRPFLELAEDELERTIAANLRGPWFFTKRLAEALIEAKRPGAVVFVSSLHDTFVRVMPDYSASKAAVSMLVRELAHELGPHRIRVNAVSPGSIHTDRSRPPPEGPHPHIPLGRVGAPEDVAPVVAALLCDEVGGYVTGANVPVDGGLALFTWSALPRG